MKYKSNFEHQCLLLVLLETLVMFQYKPEYKLVYLLPANTTSISNFNMDSIYFRETCYPCTMVLSLVPQKPRSLFKKMQSHLTKGVQGNCLAYLRKHPQKRGVKKEKARFTKSLGKLQK